MSLKEKYEQLAVYHAAAVVSAQEAYRYARDNGLIYTPVEITYDNDDESNPSFEASWESSYC